MRSLRKYLFPLNLPYRFVIYIRNWLYNYGFIKLKELNTKVISIGNISAGGTGKTPLTEYIASYLINRGKFIAVISKGYKRSADDICVAEFGFKNENAELNTENFGDEGLMLLENLSNIKNGKGILVVADNKTRGAKFAVAKFKPEVLIIDDGFQHRKIMRDLDIVLLNPREANRLLPSGNLREPLKSLKRCDIVVINKKFEDIENIPKKLKFKIYVDAVYKFNGFYNIKEEKLSSYKNRAVAFCGIADPESFKTLFINQDITIDDYIIFPDHHNYKKEDINKIISVYNSKKSDYIFTTQKDFIRFKYSTSQDIRNFLASNPVFYTKINIELTNNAKKLHELINHLIA